jgi:hypothetical protein
MDNVITVIQVLLTLFMAAAGLGRLVLPYAKVTALQPWVNDFKPDIVRLISVVEVCIAVGLIVSLFLPSLTVLTLLAAVGIALIMAGAMATHLRRGKYWHMAGLTVWLGLALFVTYDKLVGFAV